MLKRLLVFTSAFGLLACDAPDAPADGRDDTFLGGPKADGALIEEGSPDAQGVLTLVNEASLQVLDDSDEVGLDARAAANILEHRQGANADSSADDDLFDDLAELDAIPYVGPSALQRLLDYARANGYVLEPDPEVDPLAEGSALALGVLDLVNSADAMLLDSNEGVGLDSRAANNIVHHREQPNPFDSIAELDAIAYVGPNALGKLGAYAEANGYVDPQLDTGDYPLHGCGIGYDAGRTTYLRSAGGQLFLIESGRNIPVDDEGVFDFVTSDSCFATEVVSGVVSVHRESIELNFHRDSTYHQCSGNTRVRELYTIHQDAYANYDRSNATSAACSVATREVELTGFVQNAGNPDSPLDEWVILKSFRGQRTITWRRGQPTLQFYENVPLAEDGSFSTYYYSSADQIHFFQGEVADGLIEAEYGTGNYASNIWLRWVMNGFYDPQWF